MDTMRKKVLWTGGLAACVLAVAIAVRASDSKRPVAVRGAADEGGFILLDDVNYTRLEPIPDQFTVRTQYPDGDPRNGSVLAGTPPTCGGESKVVYSSHLGNVLFRPGAGNRVADDLVTELVRPCSLCSFSIRVTGGVEDGDGDFLAEVTLYDGCPDNNADGELILGTQRLFSGLDDDSGIFHDLVLDFGDRGICTNGSACIVSQQNCGDGSECVQNPLEIPTEIWARIRFNSSSAGVVVGSPPTVGFSADGYDDVFGTCRNYFGGFPTFAHATFYTEVSVPQECETHFLAYLAANPTKPAFFPATLPGGTANTRIGDDIRLTVPQCTVSAYDVGVKGTAGNFTLETDLRWPDIVDLDIVPGTEGVFSGRGESGSLEIAHTTIDENLNLTISENDQPIWLTWSSDRANTGVPEVGRTQAGSSMPLFAAFNVNPQDPGQWTLFQDQSPIPLPPGNRGIYYAAIFCRGEAPKGACCFNQPKIPGADINCVDDVPVTSCLGSRWLPNTTCMQNQFDPPCGTHACCLPNNTTDDLLYDDCREQCVLDENIISCFPVCNGGENDGLQCDPDGDGSDCPDGFCDRNGLCPGQRTCGLTGCMLAGEFTGRPCDTNNPGGGASDCMTCSISGEYCRPRCIGGTRPGRACDPNDPSTCPADNEAVPPIPAGTCDANFDCSGSETCSVQGQTCAHDDNQCSLRCARWESGEYEGQNGFECPNFQCFDAEGDCFTGEEELLCKGRCSVVTSVECRFDSDCTNQGAGPTCQVTDIDCPIGRSCVLPFGVCTGRAGCDNLLCCGEVCGNRPVCCEGSLGQTWDDRCANDAANKCDFPPGNDSCFSERPNEGANLFELTDDDTQGLCMPESLSCSSAKFAVNTYATTDYPGDPEVCCNANGVNQRVLGTIWYKFKAVHTSAEITTCGTPGNDTTVDSVIQVYKANNITPNGNDFDECNSLEVIGCNDDSGCGTTGEQADVCVTGLTPGETYYVMMGSKQGSALGKYSLDIHTPCPSFSLPEPGAECGTAVSIGPGATLFDLSDSSIDCPPETSLPGMTNDTWFSVFANFCDGPSVLTVQTCGYDLDPAQPNPGTTLAVYSGLDCPPTLLMESNDDAEVSPVCTIPVDDGDGLALRTCASAADCNRGCRVLGGPCQSDDDCVGTDTCDTNPLATCQTTSEGEGLSSEADCVVDADCTRGVCEGGTVACDLSTYTEFHCLNGDPCESVNDCPNFGACEPACGFQENSNTPVECIAQEACVPAECESECAPASFIQVPAFANQFFLIRVGGEFGTEPSGTLRVSCERDDCNENGIPDLIDIANDIDPDCNENGNPDSCDLDPVTGVSNDCNCNEIPDECEIDAAIPIDCTVVTGPCEAGPFFCTNSFECDEDDNRNGIPDCCDADVPPARCPACPQSGACCNAGVCTVEEDVNCTGLYLGDGSTCAGDPCTLGSCCQTDANCLADQVISDCDAEGEVFRPGVDCGTACDPVGACCTSGVCVLSTAADCSGVYQGDGTTCDASICTLGSCCQADLTCRADEVASQCNAGGESFRPGVDCGTACPSTSCSLADVTDAVWDDATGINQGGHCAIDARRPFDPNVPGVPEGWDRLVLTFSCDPATIGLVVGDFSFSANSGGTLPNIQSIGIAGNVATVQLDAPIAPGQWTCITAGGNEWCAGFLPANANQDAVSNASDINALINSINLVPGFVLPEYATDIDRGAVTNPSDILRLIDLLNGAGTFDPWLGASLPVLNLCPFR